MESAGENRLYREIAAIFASFNCRNLTGMLSYASRTVRFLPVPLISGSAPAFKSSCSSSKAFPSVPVDWTR